MPRFPITIADVRNEQLHSLAMAHYRLDHQEATFLLERAIADAMKELEDSVESLAGTPGTPDHAPSAR